MEEFVFMNDVKALLEAYEINVEFKKVGDVMTSIDMAGLSLTMIKLEDNWKEQINHPVTTIAW